MAKKNDNDDDDSSSSSSSDEPPPSSSSKSSKDSKKNSDKDPPIKDSHPLPNSLDDSVSPQSAPSEPEQPTPPPQKKNPPAANVQPPLPTPSRSPPPLPPPPPSIQLSPPPPSPPPPSSPPPRQLPPPSPPPNLHKGLPPPPPARVALSSFHDPSPGTSGSKSPLAPAKPPGHGHRIRSGHGGTGSSNAKSRGSSHAGDNTGKYVGFTLAGICIVVLVAIAFLTYRRKKSKGDSFSAAPYIPPPNLKFQMKPGAEGLYIGKQPGVANGPLTPRRNNFGSGSNLGGASMKHLGAPLDSSQPMSAQIAFSYDMIMEITNSFSSQNIIGQGGFGCVYKGILPDGRAVAVKQLKAGSGQGEREFRAEVEIISRVHHRHLVSLVGYCIAEEQRMLIYEYVPNGTLHHHLHGSGMPVLDWAKRLKVAIGAAKGLAYLHEDCSQKIIHRDIKSANILLDDAFEAQVADFGLARLTDTANTHVSTRVMGTFGYMAPEYATSGKLTDRSDVFSFGVVLLELVTGRKPVDESQPLGDESLVEWARPLLLHAIETRDFSELVDPRLEKRFVESEMFRMVEAAVACVRHSGPKRPRMVQVVRALDSGDEMSDLSNGVKYGDSTVYDSGQYDKDIMMFRRMANDSFVDSDYFDMYSREYGSREIPTSQHAWMRSSCSGESESRAFNTHRSSTE